MATRHYLALLFPSSDGYGVTFPDLPGCVSAGDTVEAAVANAEEALAAHIELTLEHGEEVPPPRRPEAIPAEEDEVARFLVAYRSAAAAA